MLSPSLCERVIAVVRDNPAFAASLLRDLLRFEVPQGMAPDDGAVDATISIARAVLNVLLSFSKEERLPYSLLIEECLSEPARKALAMEPQFEKLFAEAHSRAYGQGEAKGKTEGNAEREAKGKAEALVMILKQRGLAMTEEQQRQLVTCTDLPTLGRWADRVFSVTAVDDLLA